MTTINTKNDGKGKHQSWEAWIDVNDHVDNWDYRTNFVGYGATEEEAVYNCKNAIMNFTGLVKLLKLI